MVINDPSTSEQLLTSQSPTPFFNFHFPFFFRINTKSRSHTLRLVIFFYVWLSKYCLLGVTIRLGRGLMGRVETQVF